MLAVFNMAVYISIVSHGHSRLINELGCLKRLSENFNIILKSNKSGDEFTELSQSENVYWLDKDYGLGFGHNNNINFKFCINSLDVKDDDFFIVLNPDVSISVDEINKLLYFMYKDSVEFACINLFKDENYTIYDNSVRQFPIFTQFIKSFLGFKNDAILDKDVIKEKVNVDWAAGSFLAFSAKRYRELNGFDEKYFMYCEDIDICYRSYKQGYPLLYYPDIKALHYAKHQNRKLFSKHLYWHISSVFRFLLTKESLTKPSSILSN
ncbi:glycosyltransferase family 2 protein [Photobacterium leiognathi]|uniref:glycosyltransferase family 2 protein n=1 Tax=Photobacterium leiognathi TaxID=553611 RepID=UPI0029820BFB|nr:glycosyltransferase family 2 protein [Photobacterium leiognathi]